MSWLRIWVWLWFPLIVMWNFLQGVVSVSLAGLQCHEFFRGIVGSQSLCVMLWSYGRQQELEQL